MTCQDGQSEKWVKTWKARHLLESLESAAQGEPTLAIATSYNKENIFVGYKSERPTIITPPQYFLTNDSDAFRKMMQYQISFEHSVLLLEKAALQNLIITHIWTLVKNSIAKSTCPSKHAMHVVCSYLFFFGTSKTNYFFRV